MLLVGAGLMIRSLQRLQAVDPGFDSEHLLTMRVSLPPQKYRARQIVAFSQQLRERLQALPGVQSVALSSDLPLSGSTSAGPIELEGQCSRARRQRNQDVPPSRDPAVLLRRWASRSSKAAISPTAITRKRPASSSSAKPWPGVIGPTKTPSANVCRETGASDHPWLSIVGVAADVKYRGLPQNPNADPDVYFPLLQTTQRIV